MKNNASMKNVIIKKNHWKTVQKFGESVGDALITNKMEDFHRKL